MASSEGDIPIVNTTAELLPRLATKRLIQVFKRGFGHTFICVAHIANLLLVISPKYNIIINIDITAIISVSIPSEHHGSHQRRQHF